MGRGTEGGEAPGWPGATTANTGPYSRGEHRRGGGCIAGRMPGPFVRWVLGSSALRGDRTERTRRRQQPEVALDGNPIDAPHVLRQRLEVVGVAGRRRVHQLEGGRGQEIDDEERGQIH